MSTCIPYWVTVYLGFLIPVALTCGAIAGYFISRASLRDDQSGRRCKCGKPISEFSSSTSCDLCDSLWTMAYQAGQNFERQYGSQEDK